MLWIRAGILSNGTPWSARALISMICCCVVESRPTLLDAGAEAGGAYALGIALGAAGMTDGWPPCPGIECSAKGSDDPLIGCVVGGYDGGAAKACDGWG